MSETRIADLTVEELQKLIRETVQEAVAEVMIEFAMAAELDADIAVRAEMADYLRTFLLERPNLTSRPAKLDD
jgi:hypothetical protein